MLVLVGEVLAPAGRTLELMTIGGGKLNLFRTRLRNCVRTRLQNCVGASLSLVTIS